jgi:DNA-binding MarR family transcriptional regulator
MSASPVAPARPLATDPVAVIEGAVVAIVREASLSSLQERLKQAAGVSVDRAGFQVLRFLDNTGSARLSEIAAAMGLDPSTASRHVRWLEREKLIERRGDPEDRRVAVLSLSVSGVDALERLIEARNGFFAALLHDWSDEDLGRLAPLLDRLARDLQNRGREL